MKTIEIVFDDTVNKEFNLKELESQILSQDKVSVKAGSLSDEQIDDIIDLGISHKCKLVALVYNNHRALLSQGYHQIIRYRDGKRKVSSRILIATTNMGKAQIYTTILDGLGLYYCTLRDIKVDTVIDETGSTELENAKLKAEGYHKATDMPVIANDSGLIIEKFKPEDQPGVFVRRYGGSELSDQETIEIFSQKLKDVGGTSDSYFNVALVICDNDGVFYERTFKSYRYMVSTPSKVVIKGLPLRSLDYNKEYGKYMSEMTIEEANKSEGKCIEGQREFIEEVFDKGRGLERGN